MRWVLCGKNDAAVAALEFLVERGGEVWAIPNRTDPGEDGWQRSLLRSARRLGVHVEQPRNINAPEFAAKLAGFRPHALISIQYDRILKGTVLDAGFPCVNLHFSLLPRHRGVAPVAWALLEGDDEAGVTLHHMVEGIDTGNVITQRSFRLEGGETARDLYDRLTILAQDLFVDVFPFTPDDLDRGRVQPSETACYHHAGEFDFSLRRTEWSRPARELHRWLRAMIFPPLQHPETSWKGHVLRIESVTPALEAAHGVPPGTIVARRGRAAIVESEGGAIGVEISRCEDAAALSLEVGERLG